MPYLIVKTQANARMSSPSDTPTAVSERPHINIAFTPSPDNPDEGWIVTPKGDDEASISYAKNLQDVLNRTRGYRILSEICFRPVVAVLVLVWTYVLWKKHARTAGPQLGWRDAVALVAVAACTFWRMMVPAIGLTTAYIAWSSLADMAWASNCDLPGFNTFVAGLQPADKNKTVKDATPDNNAGPTNSSPEPSVVDCTEANLNLPETEDNSDEYPDCLVCWSSDAPPLQLPCTHHVCIDCLVRLKDASRYQCPFCRAPLYSLRNTKVYLFQLAVAMSGAQFALALVQCVLEIVRKKYWAAAIDFFFNAVTSAAALYGYSQVHELGEEGYFAGMSTSRLQWQLAASVYWVWSRVDGINKVDLATFVDGKWARPQAEEWTLLRQFVCWFAPKVAGYVANC